MTLTPEELRARVCRMILICATEGPPESDKKEPMEHLVRILHGMTIIGVPKELVLSAFKEAWGGEDDPKTQLYFAFIDAAMQDAEEQYREAVQRLCGHVDDNGRPPLLEAPLMGYA